MNDKQRRLVREYVKGLSNGAAAARRAGYSAAMARAQSATLLRDPEVKAAIERALAARERRTLITADRVLEEYARIAFADIRNYADWNKKGVTLRAPDELSDDDAAAVAEVTPGAKAARASSCTTRRSRSTRSRAISAWSSSSRRPIRRRASRPAAGCARCCWRRWRRSPPRPRRSDPIMSRRPR